MCHICGFGYSQQLETTMHRDSNLLVLVQPTGTLSLIRMYNYLITTAVHRTPAVTLQGAGMYYRLA